MAGPREGEPRVAVTIVTTTGGQSALPGQREPSRSLPADGPGARPDPAHAAHDRAGAATRRAAAAARARRPRQARRFQVCTTRYVISLLYIYGS